jgi:general secretion pathway protein F
MPKFRYTAIDRAGKRMNGTLEAASPGALADRLQRQNYLLLRVKEAGEGGSLLDLLQADVSFRRGLPKAVIAHLTRELSVMLESGQDMDHALRFLVETCEHKRARTILQALRDQVRGGKSLAASLSEHPKIFSRLYVSLVRAGEAGGKLALALSHLADLLEREARLTATVQSALTYPLLLLVASLGTIVLLLTLVLPQFTPIFAQAGAELPLATRVLIAIGDVVREEGVLMLLLLLGVSLAAHRILQQPVPRLAAERVLLTLPVLGVFLRRVQAARLMRTLGTLLGNGVALAPALALGRDVLGSPMAVKLVDRALTDVKSGVRLGAALKHGDFFPAQTIHLVQLGEETGRLADMALRAAAIHEDQVHHTVQRLVALLVPLVTIAMGLVVAGIVGSLLIAMLSLNDLAL